MRSKPLSHRQAASIPFMWPRLRSGNGSAGDTAYGAGRQHFHWCQPQAGRQLSASRNSCCCSYGNRHGLVTGATGTGKTVTLQILAEGFSNAGVPVFCADVKGDLSGIAMMGEAKDFLVSARRGGQARSLRVPGIPGHLLGPVRRAGPPDPRHRVGDGAAAAVAADEPHRRAGRRAQHRLPHRRRRGPAAARPEGPAGAAGQHRRARRRDRRALRQRRPSRRSARSSARCWCSSSRAATHFFGEPALQDLPTSCARRATAAARSTCSPPTS